MSNYKIYYKISNTYLAMFTEVSNSVSDVPKHQCLRPPVDVSALIPPSRSEHQQKKNTTLYGKPPHFQVQAADAILFLLINAEPLGPTELLPPFLFRR